MDSILIFERKKNLEISSTLYFAFLHMCVCAWLLAPLHARSLTECVRSGADNNPTIHNTQTALYTLLKIYISHYCCQLSDLKLFHTGL